MYTRPRRSGQRGLPAIRRARDSRRATRNESAPRPRTVHLATALGPDCASGDSERPETAPGCRRMHSLSRGVSPGAQFGPPAVAGTSAWLARTGRFDRRRRLAGKLDGWRQKGPAFAPLLSPGRQSVPPAVAGASVWPPGCRRMHSLASRRRQARSPTQVPGSRLTSNSRTERSARRARSRRIPCARMAATMPQPAPARTKKAVRPSPDWTRPHGRFCCSYALYFSPEARFS